MGFLDDILKSTIRLNSQEVAYLAGLPPHKVAAFKAASLEAEQYAKNISYSNFDQVSEKELKQAAFNSRNYGYADAVRHCYWSAMLARDLGYNDALEMVTRHEAGAAPDDLTSKMDMHNNAKGLEIGIANKDAKNSVLLEKCSTLANTGGLLVLNKDRNQLIPCQGMMLRPRN